MLNVSIDLSDVGAASSGTLVTLVKPMASRSAEVFPIA
jgi:hypothetical protein